MKKIFYAIAAAAFVLVPSCQSFEPDVFEESSSVRMTSFLEDIRETLVSESNGWSLDYYPGSAYAGTTFTLSFTGQKVTVRHESAPSVSETSTYDLKSDDGAVLSFDTYNSIMHQYATPSSRQYQAKGGDFEFEIRSFDKAAKTVTMIGKRSRNTCTLRPLAKDAEAYLQGIAAFENSLSVAAAAATIEGVEYEAYLDAGTRTMTIGEKGASDDSLQTVRYVLTENALRFASPFELGEKSFSEWTFDGAQETFSGAGVTFVKFFPPGYIAYEDYIGNYTLYYYNGNRSFPVALAEDEEGRSFKMTGLSTFFEPVLSYNGGRGRLSWVKQTIGGSGSLEYILAPWDSDAGYLTWSEGVGLVGAVSDNSVADFLVEFSDNGVWENYTAKGWLVWSMNGDSSAGAVSSWTMASGSYQLPGAISMKKIPND